MHNVNSVTQCSYNSEDCADEDFARIPTNMGFCFSFNPGRLRFILLQRRDRTWLLQSLD